MNLNYVEVVKQDLDKLLVMRFIILVEEATWLSPIVVVSKKNDKLWICMDFWKLNVATKKSLSFSFYEGSTGHGGRAWILFISRWLSKLLDMIT
jgi:hypothetical protein